MHTPWEMHLRQRPAEWPPGVRCHGAGPLESLPCRVSGPATTWGSTQLGEGDRRVVPRGKGTSEGWCRREIRRRGWWEYGSARLIPTPRTPSTLPSPPPPSPSPPPPAPCLVVQSPRHIPLGNLFGLHELVGTSEEARGHLHVLGEDGGVRRVGQPTQLPHQVLP